MIDDDDNDDAWRDDVEPEPPKKGGGPLRVVTAPGPDRRPDILIVPQVHLTTEAMTSALGSDPMLYQRGGSLVHVIRAGAAVENVTPGSPTVRDAPLSWLTDRVSRFARCVAKNKKGDWADVRPPKDSVRAVLERGEWDGIRDLRGVLEAPSLRPDGSVIQAAGYDAVTGYLFAPNAAFLPVTEAPSHSECVLAYSKLASIFRDFPFAHPSHLSATIAAILTLLARPAIVGSVPAWLFDASASRSGKSLITDAIALIATGRAASRMTYPEIDEELEKVLSAYAVRGSGAINFDNVARPFGGASLDKVITAIDEVDLRILGSTVMKSFPWTAVIFASGNNLTFRGDMAGRVLAPRLESSLDNPEARDDMSEKNLRAYVGANRLEFVHAAITILRGYVAAGRPDMNLAKWGGFEPWARLIPHALVWVGAPDPMGARRGLTGDEDPTRVAHAAIVDGWQTMCTKGAHDSGLTLKQAIAVLYPKRSAHDPVEPDGFDDLREALETLTHAKPGQVPATDSLGKSLRAIKGKPFGGRRLVSGALSGKVARWRVELV